MSEDSDPLYGKALLRLAADAPGAGRLAAPDARAIVTNPACGDQVTVELRLDGPNIAALAHDTHACILTQASMAILATIAPGMDRATVEALNAGVVAMLRDGAPPPLPAYAAFGDAATLPGRYICVLLPLRALLGALESAEPDSQGTEIQSGG